ncbi:MAG: hypothetical protein J6Y92_00370 [Lentisphaeria bacterium]|nr:hypothetical protein [Lentisphaeria bacterium]
MATKTKKKKQVRYVDIRRITANRVMAHPPCSIPPDDTELWDFEAAGEVYYDDDSSEMLFFDRLEDEEPEEPNGWVVFRKSVKEIIEAGENFADFIIAEYATNNEAFESPYGSALRYLTALFSVMTTIP